LGDSGHFVRDHLVIAIAIVGMGESTDEKCVGRYGGLVMLRQSGVIENEVDDGNCKLVAVLDGSTNERPDLVRLRAKNESWEGRVSMRAADVMKGKDTYLGRKLLVGKENARQIDNGNHKNKTGGTNLA
jgi:hypothetical protein